MHVECQHQPGLALWEANRMLVWGLSAHVQLGLSGYRGSDGGVCSLARGAPVSDVPREIAFLATSRSHWG